MAKDQMIGGIVCAVCLLVAIFYIVTMFYPQWLTTVGVQITPTNLQFWMVAVPVLVAFVAILGIGAWIGWTMATTPPPKPIKDIAEVSEEEKQ